MALTDQYGQPVKTTKPPVKSLATVAVRDKWGLYPANGLTPQRLAHILREADQGDMLEQAELFSQIEERNSHLASVMQTRKLALAGLDWTVEPFSDDAADKKIADHFRADWEALESEELVLDLADAIGKGYSVVALEWAAQNGGFTVTGSSHIDAKHWRFDLDTGFFRLLTDEHPLGLLPPFGSVIEHRYRARSGSANKTGVLRTCVWLYMFAGYSLKDWMVFSEVYGMPVRIGKYDPSTSKDERDALALAVAMIGSDAAGVISKDTEIEILEAARGSSVDVYEKLLAVCEAGISKAVLGQTLTTSEGQHGTQALGNVHERVRQDLLEADARALARTLRTQLIRPWLVFNHGAEAADRSPKLLAQISEPEDLEATSRVVQTLVNVGLPVSRNWAWEKFGIPEPKKGEELLGAAKPELPPPNPADDKTQLTALGAAADDRARSVEAQNWIDELSKNSLTATGALQAQVAAIGQALAETGSYEGLSERLAELLPELTQAELASALARAVFMADLFGRSLEQ